MRTRPDRLQAIVEQMPDGVLIASVDGTIRFANPAAEALFGRPITQLAGADLGFPSVVGDSTEIEIVRPGGITVTVELRVAETDWEGERVRLISLRDITDRKRAEERAAQLERERLARAEAEASSKAKSEFLATMSHELRTPLNAVIGYSELMELGIAGIINDEQRKHISRIRDSARHLLGLVNEVLDLAKVEAGRLAVHIRAERALSAIDAALALAQPIADARSITLVNTCTQPDLVYEGDEDRVRQILLNLLNNAVKFTPPGGRITIECDMSPTPEAAARLTGKGPWLSLRVRDTGMGIPKERIASIFDPFVQVESGKTRLSDGSGLGLTISRRLARLMNGDLTVTSEPDKGSTFILWLPEATASAREAARWRAESPAAARFDGLVQVGDALLSELPVLVDAFVDRLRAENLVPGVQSIRTTQLADHVAAYVADLASILAAIEEARGQPSRLIADGSEIQVAIAERHGTQRARLGWTPKALHLEWQLLREEMIRLLRASPKLAKNAVEEARIVLERFLEQGEEESFRAFNRANAEAASVDAAAADAEKKMERRKTQPRHGLLRVTEPIARIADQATAEHSVQNEPPPP